MARVLATAVALGGCVGLQLSSNADSATASTSGASLQPAQGQFVPVPGKLAGSFSMNAGSVYQFSVADVGVPASATAVALEYLVTANFPGVLHSGASTPPSETSVTWPANYQRAGFDTVPPNSDGVVYVKPVRSDSGTGGVVSSFSVRVHGYYTGAGSAEVGSTFVGKQPFLVYDSGAAAAPATGPNGGRSVPSNDTWVQVTGTGGVPADGSVTAAALQVVVLGSSCSGTFGLYPDPDPDDRTDVSGAFQATASDSNFDIVQVSPTGRIKIRFFGTACSSTVRVKVWLRGYYTAPTYSAAGSSLRATQTTVLDTLNGVGTIQTPSSSLCAANEPIPAGDGCTIKVGGVGSIPTTGLDGVAAQVIAYGGSAAVGGAIAVTGSSANTGGASVYYTVAGRYSNFEMATYSAVNNGSIYVYNSGADDVEVVIRVHAYYQKPAKPSQPAVANVARQGSEALVSWTAPASDGGAAITQYVVSTSPATVIAPVDVDDFSKAVSGLDPGTSYTFSVAAQNEVGIGTAAPAVPVTAEDGGTPQEPAAAANQNPIIVDSTATLSPSGVPLDVENGSAMVASNATGSAGASNYAVVAQTSAVGPTGASVTNYATEVVAPDELNADTNVAVASQPPAGTFALTGAVLNPAGNPVPSGSVSLGSIANGVNASTSADSHGVFTFYGFPAATNGTDYTLTVMPGNSSLGKYTGLATYFPGMPYEVQIPLTSSEQSNDLRTRTTEAATAAPAAFSSRYNVGKWTPPTVLVGLQNRNSDCQSTGDGSVYDTRRFAWSNYLLRTASRENRPAGQPGAETAGRANLAAVSNYTWNHVIHATTSYDIRNSTDDQCFYADEPVAPTFKRLQWDVLPWRVTNSSGALKQTYFAGAGVAPGNCARWYWSLVDAFAMDQGGSLKCTQDRWKRLLHVFYPEDSYKFNEVEPPPRPSVIYSTGANGVTIQFPSVVSKDQVANHVGWKYHVIQQNVGRTDYKTLWQGGWVSSEREIKESQFVPWNTTISNKQCATDIMVNAWNPAGWSGWTDFGVICNT